jgi:hypothetical protein
MPNYVLAYHGGKMPETPEEGAAVMAKWQAWFGGMGDAVVDGGAPVGPSKTITSGGVSDDGGSNPVSGYSVIKAADMDAAIAIAKGCPILEDGSVEIAETMDM